MRLVDEFRDPEAARKLAGRIEDAADGIAQKVRLMEVCGGHTMAIHRFGIPDLLPDGIELLSGPGCPVCVTPTAYIDRAAELGRSDGVLLATFGDLYRVPGEQGSLEDAVAAGVDVRIVYSPRDALKIAAEWPDRRVVFLGVGFETTVPTVAATMQRAKAGGVDNFAVMSAHKTMPDALRALMEAPQVAIDGFLLPGHVTTIIGTEPYRFLPEKFGTACCVTGFEPTDILRGIRSLVEQVGAGQPRVGNEYRRAVRPEGNPAAWKVVEQVFRRCDARWRGLGVIGDSGLEVRDEWSEYRVAPPDPSVPSADFGPCRCAEVLRGVIHPPDCPLFGEACVPDSPVGPCMVSSEGSCAAFYKYGGGEDDHG